MNEQNRTDITFDNSYWRYVPCVLPVEDLNGSVLLRYTPREPKVQEYEIPTF